MRTILVGLVILLIFVVMTAREREREILAVSGAAELKAKRMWLERRGIYT